MRQVSFSIVFDVFAKSLAVDKLTKSVIFPAFFHTDATCQKNKKKNPILVHFHGLRPPSSSRTYWLTCILQFLYLYIYTHSSMSAPATCRFWHFIIKSAFLSFPRFAFLHRLHVRQHFNKCNLATAVITLHDLNTSFRAPMSLLLLNTSPCI